MFQAISVGVGSMVSEHISRILRGTSSAGESEAIAALPHRDQERVIGAKLEEASSCEVEIGGTIYAAKLFLIPVVFKPTTIESDVVYRIRGAEIIKQALEDAGMIVGVQRCDLSSHLFTANEVEHWSTGDIGKILNCIVSKDEAGLTLLRGPLALIRTGAPLILNFLVGAVYAPKPAKPTIDVVDRDRPVNVARDLLGHQHSPEYLAYFPEVLSPCGYQEALVSGLTAAVKTFAGVLTQARDDVRMEVASPDATTIALRFTATGAGGSFLLDLSRLGRDAVEKIVSTAFAVVGDIERGTSIN